VAAQRTRGAAEASDTSEQQSYVVAGTHEVVGLPVSDSGDGCSEALGSSRRLDSLARIGADDSQGSVAADISELSIRSDLERRLEDRVAELCVPTTHLAGWEQGSTDAAPSSEQVFGSTFARTRDGVLAAEVRSPDNVAEVLQRPRVSLPSEGLHQQPDRFAEDAVNAGVGPGEHALAQQSFEEECSSVLRPAEVSASAAGLSAFVAYSDGEDLSFASKSVSVATLAAGHRTHEHAFDDDHRILARERAIPVVQRAPGRQSNEEDSSPTLPALRPVRGAGSGVRLHEPDNWLCTEDTASAFRPARHGECGAALHVPDSRLEKENYPPSMRLPWSAEPDAFLRALGTESDAEDCSLALRPRPLGGVAQTSATILHDPGYHSDDEDYSPVLRPARSRARLEGPTLGGHVEEQECLRRSATERLQMRREHAARLIAAHLANAEEAAAGPEELLTARFGSVVYGEARGVWEAAHAAEELLSPQCGGAMYNGARARWAAPLAIPRLEDNDDEEEAKEEGIRLPRCGKAVYEGCPAQRQAIAAASAAVLTADRATG